jgi:apolipoprotein N-acyltransferase
MLARRIKQYQQHPIAIFLSGALLALGFAPFYIWIVLSVSISLLYLALSSARSKRQAMLRGFLFGYGFCIASTYWIAYSLLVDAEKFAWLVPFSVLGLSAAMAVWWGAFALLYYTLRTSSGALAIIRARALWLDIAWFIVAFIAIELAKSFGMFAFPWNLLGYAFSNTPLLAQFASIAGVYGVSVLALLVGLVPLFYWYHKRGLMGLVLGFVAVCFYGMSQLSQPVLFTDITARIVQPNIAQQKKWDAGYARETLSILRALSLQATLFKNKDASKSEDVLENKEVAASPSVILWPETAVPYNITDMDQFASMATQLVPKDALLITGIVQAQRRADGFSWGNHIAFVKKGEALASYAKHQLVPFGEYVPLQKWLPIQKITHGVQNFTRGQGAKTIALQGVPLISPLICYESIFPQFTVDKHVRPALLVNLTNDGWFGDSPGPYQHFAMARMRAIEQGLPMLRVANTGISAVIDPHGQVLAMLPLGEVGVIDYKIPKDLGKTFYAKNAQWLLVALILILAVKAWVFYATHTRKK